MESQQLIEPIQIIRYDNCPNCHRNKLELFSYDNYPMKYEEAVINYMRFNQLPQYNRFPIYRMRCRGCGKVFNIVWRDGFPVPLIEIPDNRSINIFLNLYKKDYEDSKVLDLNKDIYSGIL